MIRIKQFREAQGLTQGQLAAQAGVSRSYLAEMESGSKSINDRRLGKIALALGVTLADLLEPDDERASAMSELSAITRRLSPRDIELVLQVARSADRAGNPRREPEPQARPGDDRKARGSNGGFSRR